MATRAPTRSTSGTVQATVQSSKSSIASTLVPPSIVPALPTPPSSIDKPLCPEPKSVILTSPLNGSGVTGIVQIRGTVEVRQGAQPYRYSLYYRSGIVRESMDGIADEQAPITGKYPNGRNVPIQVVYFQAYDGPIVDQVVGWWDTTKLSMGWYSLRLWNKDRGGNFIGCDVYVFVR